MVSLLETLVRGQDLFEERAVDLFHTLTDPRTDPALSGALLAALRAKGAAPSEVRGLATAMREAATPVVLPEGPSVDLVGTGGDGSGSLNLSTGSALLTAACGLPVVKHGNRSVSSQSGSADVLERLGYTIPDGADAALESLRRVGFTFLFAPHFHPAMRTIAPVRAALGIRTVFNILGPLTNPAAPPFAVIGAFSPQMARLMADALSGLGIERAFVVHGEPGWDEATPCGPFLRYDVRPGSVEEAHPDPRDHGVPRCDPAELAGGDPAYNAAALRDAFAGEGGPHADALALGAGLALEVSGEEPDLDRGVTRARAALEDGTADRFLRSLADAS